MVSQRDSEKGYWKELECLICTRVVNLKMPMIKHKDYEIYICGRCSAYHKQTFGDGEHVQEYFRWVKDAKDKVQRETDLYD